MKFSKSLRILLACCCVWLFHATSTAAPTSQSELIFVAGKNGIFAYRMNSQTGDITNLGVAAEISGPQFIAIHPNHNFLFTLNTANLDGKTTGLISAFKINLATGKLAFLNQQSTVGAGPTHLAVDGAGKNVVVANYGNGSVAAFPIQQNGELNPATAFIQHHGSSIDPQRQEGPHAHSITTDPANRFVISCDLGLDKVMVYKFDSAKGTLAANDPAFVSVKAGAGPRHHAFAPSGKYLYVINELDSTMTAFRYDAQRGTLQEFQTLSTLPKDFSGKNYPSEVAVHPSGKFLYGSNRGHDSIVVFGIDQKTGTLTAIEHQSTGGKTPRHFEIDPTGNYLFAANQDSGSVVVFRLDPKAGRLNPTGTKLEVEAPQCVKFLPAP